MKIKIKLNNSQAEVIAGVIEALMGVTVEKNETAKLVSSVLYEIYPRIARVALRAQLSTVSLKLFEAIILKQTLTRMGEGLKDNKTYCKITLQKIAAELHQKTI